MARLVMKRGRFLVVLAALGAGAISTLPAASASAEIYYNENGCVVQQLIDGAPAGGSQCAGADLSHMSLGQSALMGADVSGADFSGSKLQAASFVGANIEGANFTNSQVDGADFTDAGILPGTIDAVATGPEGAAVQFAPVVPTGLTPGECTVVDVPVASGAVFPIGVSSVLCRFASSNGSAIAVVTISVTAPPGATNTPEPLFTEEPSAAPVVVSRPPTNWTLIGTAAAGAVAVLGLGIAAMVFARRRPAEDDDSADERDGPDSDRQ